MIQPVPGLLADYRSRQRYLLIDEIRLADSGNLPQRNLSAALFRLEASRGPDEVLKVLKRLVEWLRAPEQAGLRRTFTVWFQRVFLPRRLPGVDLTPMNDLSEVQTMVSERFESWTERWERQGIEKGMQKGLQQGLQQGLQRQRHGLLRQVRKRFGAEVAERSAPLLERIDNPEWLEDLGEALLDSADGEDWLQVLAGMAER